jgi:hypothetical protein
MSAPPYSSHPFPVSSSSIMDSFLPYHHSSAVSHPGIHVKTFPAGAGQFGTGSLGNAGVNTSSLFLGPCSIISVGFGTVFSLVLSRRRTSTSATAAALAEAAQSSRPIVLVTCLPSLHGHTSTSCGRLYLLHSQSQPV